MEAVIVLAVIILTLVFIAKKGTGSTSPSTNGTPPAPLPRSSKAEPASSPVGTCSDLLMLERTLQDGAELARTDPTHYRNATGAVVVVCARELKQLNIGAAIARPALTWNDVAVATEARALVDIGLRRGEEHCAFVGHELADGIRDAILFLYSTAALVSRLDGDCEEALRRNMRRIEHASDPDEVSESLIEAMLSDASRGGGAKRGAETLMFFSSLSDARPGWDKVITPRVRRVVNNPR